MLTFIQMRKSHLNGTALSCFQKSIRIFERSVLYDFAGTAIRRRLVSGADEIKMISFLLANSITSLSLRIH